MERRTLLAITLSLLVLLSWSAFVSKPQHIDNQEVTSKKAELPTPHAISPTPPGVAIPQSAPEPEAANLLIFPQNNMEVVFSEQQATINETIFSAYQNYAFKLKNSFLLNDPSLIFREVSLSAGSAIFSHEDEEKKIIKRFLFSKRNYTIELELEIQNLSQKPIGINLPLILGTLDFGDATEARFKDVTISLPEKILHLNPRKERSLPGFKFMGLRDRYFCLIIEPESDNYTAYIKKTGPLESEIGLISENELLNPGMSLRRIFHIYLGPQELASIAQVNPDWTTVMHMGFFNPISHLLLKLLRFIYGIVQNWGLAIVVISILIYFLLFPLSLKQMRSMKQMQALQPHIEELRGKYKDNPQKLNIEIMNLYRTHKVNPFSGCLPLILQIPVFFSLYQALIRSVALKGAPFLWIKDLSAPDRLFILPTSLPLIGNEVNILPILMMIGMFMQQKLTSVATGGSSAEQQKIMLIIFPLMFGIIFYHMPSGLVLYWFINSSCMLIQQLKLRQVK